MTLARYSRCLKIVQRLCVRNWSKFKPFNENLPFNCNSQMSFAYIQICCVKTSTIQTTLELMFHMTDWVTKFEYAEMWMRYENHGSSEWNCSVSHTKPSYGLKIGKSHGLHIFFYFVYIGAWQSLFTESFSCKRAAWTFKVNFFYFCVSQKNESGIGPTWWWTIPLTPFHII